MGPTPPFPEERTEVGAIHHPVTVEIRGARSRITARSLRQKEPAEIGAMDAPVHVEVGGIDRRERHCVQRAVNERLAHDLAARVHVVGLDDETVRVDKQRIGVMRDIVDPESAMRESDLERGGTDNRPASFTSTPRRGKRGSPVVESASA